MPGEFNDLIPLPRQNPRMEFTHTPIEQILAGTGDAVFDADDVSLERHAQAPATAGQRAVQTPLPVILAGQVEEDPIGLPRPTPAFGAREAVPERRAAPAGSNMASRVADAIGRGANRPFREDGPIGFDPETVAWIREMGVFNRDPNNSNLIGTANEVLIGGGTALADLALRSLAAVGEGAIAGFGQALQEAGMSRGGARRAERDARAWLTALSLAGAAAPVAAAGLPTAARVRRMKKPPFRPDLWRYRMPEPSTAEDFRIEIDHVLETGESSIGMVRNKHLGPITIDFGTPGVGPKFRSGFGLSHVAAKRTAVDGIDGKRFVRERLPEILARGRLQEFQRDGSDRRAVLDLGEDRVVLSLFREDEKIKGKPKRETWILTGFEKNGK